MITAAQKPLIVPVGYADNFGKQLHRHIVQGKLPGAGIVIKLILSSPCACSKDKLYNLSKICNVIAICDFFPGEGDTEVNEAMKPLYPQSRRVPG